MDGVQSRRGFLSTLLMSVFASGIGGLLWIGRPLYAAILYVAIYAATWSVLSGWATLPPLLSPYNFILLLFAAVTLVPLLFRRHSVPKGWSSKWYFVIAISWIAALTGSVAIRSLAYQPFDIGAGSMIPTLMAGDYLTADKSAYGYSRFSFPLELARFSGRIAGNLPARGDVALFEHDGVVFVKRIVGLPGETIQMINGVPVIDGAPLKHEVIGTYRLEMNDRDATLVRETLPDGRSYHVIDIDPETLADNTSQFTIPADSYFMLGDHRDNSNDSRFGLGFIPYDHLIGRADHVLANSNGLPFEERRNVK